MDIESLKAEAAENKNRDPIVRGQELRETWHDTSQALAGLFRIIGDRVINLGEVGDGFTASAVIYGYGPREYLLAHEAERATFFVVIYRLHSATGPDIAVQETLGGDRLLTSSTDWDVCDLAAAEEDFRPMVEEGRKTLAMLIKAAKDPALNPDLAGLAGEHHEKPEATLPTVH